LVWIDEADSPVSWDDEDALADLVEVEAPEGFPEPLTTLPNYSSVCDGATAFGRFPGTRPYKLFADRYSGSFDADALPTSTDEVDLVLCLEADEAVLQNCPYTSNYKLVRVRRVTVVKLVNYESGDIAVSNRFNGSMPDRCPQSYRFSTLTEYLRGDAAPSSDWLPWVERQLGSGTATAPSRSIVNANGMNARSEATTASDVITTLAYGTPINIIARNEAGDWVVAILPDGTQAWLFVNLIRTGVEIDSLPVADGAAADVPIQFKVPNSQ
jgi:hypothetical protein